MRGYCYLNHVFVDNTDNSVCYEVVMSDETFSNPVARVIDFGGLVELCNDTELETDFKIEDGYLQCNDDVERSIFQEIVWGNNGITCFDDSTLSLFSILKLGLENEFCIVDDEVLETNDWVGNGIVPFRKIRFSQSSMSIYAKMIIENRMRNFYLVRVENGSLQLKGFNFAVPSDSTVKVEACEYLKTMWINNTEFCIYHYDAKQIMIPLQKIMSPMINKACCEAVKANDAIKVLEAYKSDIYRALGYKQEKLNWESNDYDKGTSHSVIFEAKCKRIADVSEVLHKGFQISKETNNLSEALAEIRRHRVCPSYRLALMCVVAANKESNNETELLNNIQSFLKDLEIKRFYCDCFTYKVRLFSYLTGRKLVSAMKPYFTGSPENCITLVKEEI